MDGYNDGAAQKVPISSMFYLFVAYSILLCCKHIAGGCCRFNFSEGGGLVIQEPISQMKLHVFNVEGGVVCFGARVLPRLE